MEAIPRKFSPEELAALTAVAARQTGREFDARKAGAEMALRQWCVEQAIASNVSGGADSVTEVAKHILDFVSAPLKPEGQNG